MGRVGCGPPSFQLTSASFFLAMAPAPTPRRCMPTTGRWAAPQPGHQVSASQVLLPAPNAEARCPASSVSAGSRASTSCRESCAGGGAPLPCAGATLHEAWTTSKARTLVCVVFLYASTKVRAAVLGLQRLESNRCFWVITKSCVDHGRSHFLSGQGLTIYPCLCWSSHYKLSWLRI